MLVSSEMSWEEAGWGWGCRVGGGGGNSNSVMRKYPVKGCDFLCLSYIPLWFNNNNKKKKNYVILLISCSPDDCFGFGCGCGCVAVCVQNLTDLSINLFWLWLWLYRCLCPEFDRPVHKSVSALVVVVWLFVH